jgi:hypothetical protein
MAGQKVASRGDEIETDIETIRAWTVGLEEMQQRIAPRFRRPEVRQLRISVMSNADFG